MLLRDDQVQPTLDFADVFGHRESRRGGLGLPWLRDVIVRIGEELGGGQGRGRVAGLFRPLGNWLASVFISAPGVRCGMGIGRAYALQDGVGV